MQILVASVMLFKINILPHCLPTVQNLNILFFSADPGVRDAEGCAAIHVAVQCGHTSIVAYLIAKGVDPDSYDANGKTPLMWAAWRTLA